MTEKNPSPLLLFYPTSPVHVRDMQLLMEKLPGWRCSAVLYRPLEKVAPGIDAALHHYRIRTLDTDDHSLLDTTLPRHASVLVLGAVFEPFALELFAWAKLREIAVIAIQEVAQLALNQLDINNYDAPFDRLFVASPEEQRRFIRLGYPPDMLRVSGLLAYDRFSAIDLTRHHQVINSLGIAAGKKPVVYTTSPLRSRLALHNKDDLTFRKEILAQLSKVSRNTNRPVIIKFHPNENIESYRQIIQDVIPNAILLGRELSTDELLPITGVLVNRGNSQTCLDAVLRGIPTVVIACGLKTLFHDDGGAYIIESLGGLANTIETALNLGKPDNTRVRSNHFYLPARGVANYIAGEIVQLSDEPAPVKESTWNWLIKSRLFIGRHDRGLAFCEKLPSRTSWQELVYLALKAHSRQEVSDTIPLWLECAALDPKWYFPHYELAHAYQATGQFDDAIAHARKAIELHPPFHSLWHEIPMRVVMMASLRGKGDLAGAMAELKALEIRGLVEIVPELLIEAAAQYCSSSGRLEAAERFLEKAVEQLQLYPVAELGDRYIGDRAALQYGDLAVKYAETGDSPRSAACLARAIDLARPDTAHWLRYQQSRMALKRRNLRQTFGGLFTLATIPNAPRAIIERILSPAGATRLASYWPASPKSILNPLVLWFYMSGWFFSRLARSGLRDILTSLTAVILVSLYVAMHFVNRLRMELKTIRQIFYRMSSLSLFSFVSHRRRVDRCPICSARGEFKYQNKLTSLFQCLECGHVWARDLPDDQALNALYSDFAYWERDRHHQGITVIQEGHQWQAYLDARLGILQKLKLLDNPVRPDKNIFEIGCAEGMLLHELGKRGMEATGCEVNRPVAAEGMKALGVDIITAPFEEIELPAKHFDLVMSFHTLEHLRDPAGVLDKVVTILRLDGAVLLEVPCGKEEYENTDHLHFFSETSLRTLLNKFFITTEILDNSYTNSTGVRIGSIYGVGRGVRHRAEA